MSETHGVVHADKPLLEAFLAFQQKVPALVKDAVNPHFRNRYVSLDAISQTITPILSECGLVWTTMPVVGADGPTLYYRLMHAASGQHISGEMPLLLSKNDMQGLGSAVSYARRYAISAVLGLSAEDDDGNAAAQTKPKRPAMSAASREAAGLEPMMTTMAVKQLQKEVKDAKLNWETLLGAHGIEPGGRMSVANGAKILKALRQAIPVDPKRPLTDEEREKVLTAVGAANLLEEVETRVGAPAEEWTTHDAKRIREILDERKKAA